MGSKMDLAARGMNVLTKLIVSALWVGICIVGFSVGVWYVGLLAIAYLIYLWLFGGQWLIY